MVNRRTVRRRPLGPARKFVWARAGIFSVVAAESSTTLDLLQTFQTEYGVQLLGATVMRIRGVIRVNPAATASATAVIGAIVGDDGIVSPNSIEQPHADWMSYAPVVIGHGDASMFNDWEADVKSSRKIEELGQTLHLVLANPLAVTAMNFSGRLSVGLKLP